MIDAINNADICSIYLELNRSRPLVVEERVVPGPSGISPLTLFSALQKQKVFQRTFVGELHEKWQFPSDHLPVGVAVDDFQVVSWNVLNNAYIDWVIEKDSQGLKGSMLSDLHATSLPGGHTMRDQRVIDMIQSMIDAGNDIIALQECGESFLQALDHALPSHWSIVRTSDQAVKDQGVILYNATIFSYHPELSSMPIGVFSGSSEKSLMSVLFTSGEKSIRIINAHIPGDPKLPSTEEFASYVYAADCDANIQIALGDHNFERQEMRLAYQKAGYLPHEYSLHSPWKTNIDPYTKESKAIDHIFVRGASSRSLQPEEISNGYNLAETINLLG